MATEQQFDQDKNKNQPMNEPSTIGGAPPAIGGSQGSSSPTVAQKPTSSGRFTNIQNFIRANQNANLGQNISGKIGGIATNVGNDIQKERQGFQEKTAQAFKPFVGGKEFAQGGIQNAAKFLTDDPNTEQDETKANLDRFTTIRQGQYQGPQDLSNAEVLRAGAENVNSLANLTGSESGRNAVLGSFFSRPSYNQGQRSLDNLLLQADPRQIAAMSGIKAPAARVGRDLSQAQSASRQEGALNKKNVRNLGQQITSELGTEKFGRDTELDKKLQTIQESELQKHNEYARLANDIAGGSINEADAKRLGLDTSNDELSLYGLQVPDYLNTNEYQGPMTREAVADQDQAARINALYRLSGSQTGPLDMNNINKYTSSSQNIKDTFAGDLAKGKARYDALAAAKAGQEARFNQLQGLYQQADLGRQQAALNAVRNGQSVADVNAAYGASAGYDQLLQGLYGGEKARDIGFLGQIGNDLANQRANAINPIEAQLAALRNKLRIIRS